ncbi:MULTISPECIES: hypothetical protein [Halorussus]|uniref:DUF7504 family protein n=1 Tax=Halorussus TaxID=1070314 RepID=UPI000E2118A5|nr:MULTISPECIES: hypothetical protein [Halorussus]NHN59528.1 hypothetical protein [Halorussus sp. JP-T4]
MSSPESAGSVRGTGPPVPDDDLANFLDVLNELKSTGCNLLVVGDAPRELFARASARMLGDDDATRYRVLAATDATPGSIADRLPDPTESSRPVGETTHVLNHVGAVRSVTASADETPRAELAGVKETRVADPQLAGLQSALVEAIDDFATRAGDSLEPAALRVGVDSLAPLVDFHGEDVVRRCLRIVGGHVRKRDAMAHYVLPKPYDSELVRAFAPAADAVVEVRLADAAEDGRVGEQRWHVPNRELSVGWTPL